MAASIPAGSVAAAPALVRSLALLLLLRLSLDRSLAQLLLLRLSLARAAAAAPALARSLTLLLLLSPSLVLLLCSDLATLQSLNRLLGQSILRGWGARRSKGRTTRSGDGGSLE